MMVGRSNSGVLGSMVGRLVVVGEGGVADCYLRCQIPGLGDVGRVIVSFLGN